MLDQATKLREKIKDLDKDKATLPKVISIISGVEEVGKRHFAINLANSFIRWGKEAIVLNGKKDLSNLKDYEIIIIDTKDGVNRESLECTSLSHETILVTSNEDEIITYTYAFIKVLSQEGIKDKLKIHVNNTEDKNSHSTFYRLNETSKKFLNIHLQDITNIREDKLVELLYNGKEEDDNQLIGKIINILGG